MFKIRLNKRIASTLVGTLLTAPLGLMPLAANASNIDPGPAGIYEMGSLRWDPRLDNPSGIPPTNGDLGEDGLTKFTVDFGTDLGLLGGGKGAGAWLLMNASSTAPDEEIVFQLLNHTSATINNLWLEFRTVSGGSLGAISDRPTLDHWAATISDSSASVDVSVSSSTIENAPSYQRVNLVFSTVMPDNSGGQLFLNTGSLLAKNAGFGCLGTCPPDKGTGEWIGFNPGGDWYFNIDPGTANLNGPPLATPIPGAVWLLGSALLGLVARSSRRRDASKTPRGAQETLVLEDKRFILRTEWNTG